MVQLVLDSFFNAEFFLIGNIFTWCFYQWVDEKGEKEDSDSGDYNCDCVIEWRGEGSLESGYVLLG